MILKFKPGDRVHLTRAAVALYGGAWPHFVPESQGGGTPGTVILAVYRGEEKPGAAPRPYFVHWNNGVQNSYRVEDLQRDDPVATMARLRGLACEDLMAITDEDLRQETLEDGEDIGEIASRVRSTMQATIVPFRRSK